MDVMSLSCGIDNSRFYWFLFLFFFCFFFCEICLHVCLQQHEDKQPIVAESVPDVGATRHYSTAWRKTSHCSLSLEMWGFRANWHLCEMIGQQMRENCNIRRCVLCVFCLLYFMPPQSYYTFWNLSILYSPVRLHNAFPDIGYSPAHRSHLSKTTTPREFSWGFWDWSAQENPQWLMGRREFLQTHFASSLTAALK